MSRVFNFSAGPAALPESVLERARDELLDYRGSGMSVMEMSHRSDEFIGIAARAERDLRELLAIPADYHVLFQQGGATQQFAMVPQNLMPEGASADYLDTGSWSIKAIEEARRYGRVNVVASSKADKWTRIPPRPEWRTDPAAAYFHYTLNETIGGVEFHAIPDVGAVPLVTDASSTLLSRPLDVSRFGLIYAGAQKNIGPAGITVVIIRPDLVGRARPGTPAFLDYKVQADAESMYNTPPTYAWYLAGLVFEWVKEQGGLAGMAGANARKASRLYGAIDGSNFYRCPVAREDRSWMNVPFTLARPELDAAFLAEAHAAGLTNLKGHRSVGGMRASLYNAVPEAAVEALVAFMADFASRHG